MVNANDQRTAQFELIESVDARFGIKHLCSPALFLDNTEKIRNDKGSDRDREKRRNREETDKGGNSSRHPSTPEKELATPGINRYHEL